MLRSKRKIINILINVLFISTLSSCMGNSKTNFAPRSIANYTIEFIITQDSDPSCTSYKNKRILYIFYSDGSYTSKVNGKPYMSGNFTYKREASNRGKLALSYSLENQLYSDISVLHFQDHSNGTWNDLINTRTENKKTTGTFKIIGRGK